jgi:Flp pilus assembly protein TadD
VPSLWQSYAEAAEMDRDTTAWCAALEGYTANRPTQYSRKVRLATLHAVSGNVDRARELADHIVDDSVRMNPDFHFLQGLFAEEDGKTRAALKAYSRAVGIRRYDAGYHRALSRVLEKLGRKEEADRAESWAELLAVDPSAREPTMAGGTSLIQSRKGKTGYEE